MLKFIVAFLQSKPSKWTHFEVARNIEGDGSRWVYDIKDGEVETKCQHAWAENDK